MIIDNLLQYSFGLLVIYWLVSNPKRRKRVKEIFINTVKKLEGDNQ